MLINKNISANVEEKSISFSSDSEISIAMEGNLSEKELEDIKKAIKLVDKIMQELKSGDIEKAMKLANDTINLDSISCLSASMELEKSVTLKEQLQASYSILEGPEKPADDSPENRDSLIDKINSLTDRIMDIINNVGVDKSKMIKPLESYLSQSIKDHPDKSSDNHNNKDDIFKMTSEMLQDRIKEMNDELPVEGSGQKSITMQ